MSKKKNANKITKREALALGYLNVELSQRAQMWGGKAPEWFPVPPVWVELWEQALEATAEEREKKDD